MFGILFQEIGKILDEWFQRPEPIKSVIIKPEHVTTNTDIASNRTAFLAMIAVSEGTQNIGDNGYNALFGGGTFTGYADHPRREFYIKRLNIWTSAAGRYQIEKQTFDDYKKLLKLPDFSPSSQDAIALQLITERHAMPDVDAGRVGLAINKCASAWASFEGSKAGQPITPTGVLMVAYSKAGGKFEDWRQT